jgi:2-polyprenyl-3-methyl-5-hydroxy-6-metoxy-1,4-benzoquinol methylase
MDLGHLETLRLSELERVLTEIKSEKPNGGVILEIGAGTGWQAKKMAENGYHVEAIDIEDSGYSTHRIWPITNYDGKCIPFPCNYFDIVFSSNVLEHIPHVVDLQIEIKRVLKPDGIAVHVLPSVSWRFWTNVAHYPFVFKTIIKIVYPKIMSLKCSIKYNRDKIYRSTQTKCVSKKKFTKNVLYPHRHGEIGTAVSELYYFSRYRWNRLFRKTGWKIKNYYSTKLFYTAYMIFGPSISIRLRTFLSYILGSSCHIFVLIKREKAPLGSGETFFHTEKES